MKNDPTNGAVLETSDSPRSGSGFRRGFSRMILDKFDAKASGIDPAIYEDLRFRLAAIIDEFEKLIAEAKNQ